MTFEEMQATISQMLAVQRELQETQLRQQEGVNQQIAGMLAVQRELQESQLKLQDTQLRQQEEINRQIRLVDRLIGYSITNETDHLNLEERMTALERRMQRLEGSDN